MEFVIVFATIIAPLSAAFVELLKVTFKISKNYIPLLSVVVGIVLAIVAYPFTDLDLINRIWSGALAGLSGTGMYELVAKREGTTKDDDDQDIMDEKY